MLKGKSAIITGGVRGIGFGIAEECAKQGADIMICYRSNEDAAAKAAAELEELLVMEVTPEVEAIDIPITENLLLSANDIGLLTPFVHFTEE